MDVNRNGWTLTGMGGGDSPMEALLEELLHVWELCRRKKREMGYI
jgi:hypothetical protein